MRAIFMTLVLLFFAFPIFAQEQNKPQRTLTASEKELLNKDLNGVLRGFIWGVPRTVILENETGTFMDEQDGTLFYMDDIRGLRSTIGYEFQDDKLSRAKIFVEKQYSHPPDRITDILTIQMDLNRRFGKPVKEEFKWRNDREKNFPDNWGWAVYRGELFITSEWKTKDTYVKLFLGAYEAFEPELSVSYEAIGKNIAENGQKTQKQTPNLLLTP